MCLAAYVLLRDKIEQLLHFFFGVKGSCGSFHEGCHRSPSGKAQTGDSKGICIIPKEESSTPRKNLKKNLECAAVTAILFMDALPAAQRFSRTSHSSVATDD
jgi:hypothetical protein